MLPPPTRAEPDANRLAGTVRDVSYIGVSTQYIIDTPTGEELVAIVQNAAWRTVTCHRAKPCKSCGIPSTRS